MRGKAWTSEDDYICMSEDLSIKEKAELLGRTVHSIRNHICRIYKYGENYKQMWALACKKRNSSNGCNDNTRLRRWKRWEPTEDDYILNNLMLSDNEIGIELGRSEAGVRLKRYELTRRMWG